MLLSNPTLSLSRHNEKLRNSNTKVQKQILSEIICYQQNYVDEA